MKFYLYTIKRKADGEYLGNNFDRRQPKWGDIALMWKTIGGVTKHIKWLTHEHILYTKKIGDWDYPLARLGKEREGETDKYQVEIWLVSSLQPPEVIDAKEFLKRNPK